MRPYSFHQPLYIGTDDYQDGEPLFSPLGAKWRLCIREILAGVGIALFAIVWFTIAFHFAAAMGSHP
jgi:hypothetical protein